MSSAQNLSEVLSELHFSKAEEAGFRAALQVARSYMRNGDVDMEKQFKAIVEKVVKDEIQEDQV